MEETGRLRRGPGCAGPALGWTEEKGLPLEKKDYGALRAVWPRPWEDDDAADQQAFTAALQVASASVIIAGAKERVKAVAERNKDKGPDWVSFLPTLAKYLKGRGWENRYPRARAVRRAITVAASGAAAAIMTMCGGAPPEAISSRTIEEEETLSSAKISLHSILRSC